MTIADMRGICKSFLGKIPKDVLIAGIGILLMLLSFWFGYLAGKEREEERRIRMDQAPIAHTEASEDTETTGQVMASKNGTKYYPPGCAGGSRISSANKIWFTSSAAAIAAGYTLAASCK